MGVAVVGADVGADVVSVSTGAGADVVTAETVAAVVGLGVVVAGVEVSNLRPFCPPM